MEQFYVEIFTLKSQNEISLKAQKYKSPGGAYQYSVFRKGVANIYQWSGDCLKIPRTLEFRMACRDQQCHLK